MRVSWIDGLTFAVRVATTVVLIVAGIYFFLGVGLVGVALFFPMPGASTRLLLSAAMLGIGGYGLFALAWLVVRAPSIRLRDIPGNVWCGVACGTGLAVWYLDTGWLRPIRTDVFFQPRVFNDLDNVALATLLACLAVLATVWLRGRDASKRVRTGRVD